MDTMKDFCLQMDVVGEKKDPDQSSLVQISNHVNKGMGDKRLEESWFQQSNVSKTREVPIKDCKFLNDNFRIP